MEDRLPHIVPVVSIAGLHEAAENVYALSIGLPEMTQIAL